MAQTITLSDETQTVTISLTSGYPVLYSVDRVLREALIKIGELHAIEPIDTINFQNTAGDYTLTVTLNDARVAAYAFTNVSLVPTEQAYTIAFTGGTWEETSLDLLDSVKDGILKLNSAFVFDDGDSFDWASI